MSRLAVHGTTRCTRCHFYITTRCAVARCYAYATTASAPSTCIDYEITPRYTRARCKFQAATFTRVVRFGERPACVYAYGTTVVLPGISPLDVQVTAVVVGCVTALDFDSASGDTRASSEQQVASHASLYITQLDVGGVRASCCENDVTAMPMARGSRQ